MTKVITKNKREGSKMSVTLKRKIEKGARDFAVRFEDVMKDLSNG